MTDKILSDGEIGEVWIEQTLIDLPGEREHPVWLKSTDVLTFARALLEKVRE